MRIQLQHKDFTEDKVKDFTTQTLRGQLEEKGLTKSQATNCIKSVRKKLKIYRKER